MTNSFKRLPLVALLCIATLHAQTGNSITQSFFTAANTTAVTITNAAGVNGKTLYGWNIVNPNASICWLQFFNSASGSVTLGTTVPTFSIQVLATANNNQQVGTLGLAFSQGGWSIASTTTATGSSTCATGMSATVFFN